MKYLVTIIAVLAVAWGAYWLVTRNGAEAVPQGAGTAAGDTQLADSEVKTFIVVGRPYSFTPSVIEVNEGDSVRIVFQNEEGTHDWVIDEFDARTNVVQAGESETLDF